jgi:hypothetical protein
MHATVSLPRPPHTGDTMSRSPLHEPLEVTSRLADPVATVLARERLDGMLAALPALTVKEHAALTGELNGKSNGSSPTNRAQPERRSRPRCAAPATSSPHRRRWPPSPNTARLRPKPL